VLGVTQWGVGADLSVAVTGSGQLELDARNQLSGCVADVRVWKCAVAAREAAGSGARLAALHDPAGALSVASGSAGRALLFRLFADEAAGNRAHCVAETPPVMSARLLGKAAFEPDLVREQAAAALASLLAARGEVVAEQASDDSETDGPVAMQLLLAHASPRLSSRCSAPWFGS
jgi:hypothetical protein